MNPLKKISMLLITAAILCHSLISCSTSDNDRKDTQSSETGNVSVSATDDGNESEEPTDTEKSTEAETEEPAQVETAVIGGLTYDISPLTLHKPTDRYPDYKNYEKAETGKSGAKVTDVTFGYDAELTGENKEIYEDAAKVSVLDSSYPILTKISHYFSKDGEISYSVTDYYGKKLTSGKLTGKQGEIVTLSRGVKNHPTGYFTVTVNGKTYPYVVTPSFENRTDKDTPFAMDFAATGLYQTVEDTKAMASAGRLAGVNWVRERALWSSYEPLRGKYDFESTDAHFRAIDKTGMKILANFALAPNWATSILKSEGLAGGFLKNQISTYKLTKAISEHYKGIVDAWELCNETDMGRAETAEQYAAWFKAGALGLIAGDPDAVISHAGFCQPDSMYSYVHLALANDVMHYSSIFNYHCHVAQMENWNMPNFVKTLDNLPKQLYSTTTAYGAASKPIWVTEAGMQILTTKPSQKQLINQARYIVTSTAQSLSLGTDKHFWFLLAPYLENGGDYGTFSADHKPYPTLAAESVMTSVLGEAKYLGEIPGIKSYNDSKGVLFYTGSRMSAVLWTFDSKGKDSFTFETDKPAILTDLMGNETLVEPENGKIKINYGGEPVFVTFSEPLADYYAQEHSSPTLEKLTFTESDKIVMTPEFEGYDINDEDTKKLGHFLKDGMTVKVRIGNYNDFAITGTVSVKIPGFEVSGTEKSVTVKPLKEEFVTLTLKQTSDEEFNEFVAFEGNFGEYSSRAVAQVRTAERQKRQNIAFAGVKDGQKFDAEELKTLTAKFSNIEGTVSVFVDNKPYESFTVNGSEITISTSDIPEGKHTITAGIKTEGGDWLCNSVTMRFDGKTYIFYPNP